MEFCRQRKQAIITSILNNVSVLGQLVLTYCDPFDDWSWTYPSGKTRPFQTSITPCQSTDAPLHKNFLPLSTPSTTIPYIGMCSRHCYQISFLRKKNEDDKCIEYCERENKNITPPTFSSSCFAQIPTSWFRRGWLKQEHGAFLFSQVSGIVQVHVSDHCVKVGPVCFPFCKDWMTKNVVPSRFISTEDGYLLLQFSLPSAFPPFSWTCGKLSAFGETPKYKTFTLPLARRRRGNICVQNGHLIQIHHQTQLHCVDYTHPSVPEQSVTHNFASDITEFSLGAEIIAVSAAQDNTASVFVATDTGRVFRFNLGTKDVKKRLEGVYTGALNGAQLLPSPCGRYLLAYEAERPEFNSVTILCAQTLHFMCSLQPSFKDFVTIHPPPRNNRYVPQLKRGLAIVSKPVILPCGDLVQQFGFGTGYILRYTLVKPDVT